MTKTERAGDATALAVRSVAAAAAGSRRDRASRYATAAKMAAAAAGIGGAAGVVEAAIISGNTPVVLTSPGLAAPTFQSTGLGDTLVANVFKGRLRQSVTYGLAVRAGGIWGPDSAALNDGIHRNLLGVGAVVGGAGMTFNNSRMYIASLGTASGSVAANTSPPFVVIDPTSNSLRGFVGFRFDDSGTTLYGYFDVEWSRTGVNQGSILTVIIHGWAYDNSGAAITIGGATPIPGGTGLAALAIGAAGLRGRRRSRN